MARGRLESGETILLVDERGRRYLKRLKSGHRMTVRGTVLACDAIIGGPEGRWVGQGEPERFLVFRAGPADLVTKTPRASEPIFPKDQAALILRAGIRGGDRVVEVGAGAGLFTVALLDAVGDRGAVTTYEIRPEAAEQARLRVRERDRGEAGWTLIVADARAGIDQRGVDHVVADIPDPAELIPRAASALRPGGTFAFYVPTVPQFARARQALADEPRFALAETLEVFERFWHVDAQSVRPDHRMVAHTGFISMARRTAI